MNRRTAIRHLGLASLAPWLIAFSKTAAVEAAAHGDDDSEKIWRDGVAFARWAPSAHNVQPWRLRVLSKDAAEL